GPERPNVSVTLRMAGRFGRHDRKLPLVVDALDKREEIADLAYRLGSVAGMPYQRVVRNDPQEIEIELGREGTMDFTRTPAIEAHADYVSDVVTPAAVGAAEREAIPKFDPAQLSGDY